MIFREKATTRIDDFGADGYMLLPALLKVLENAADHHSASVADESVEDSMHGVAWILAEWRVELIKPPTFNDEIRVETCFSGETTFSLRRSEIDYNGHVHNTNYLCFAQEVLSESAAQSTAIASFRISYKRPLRFGDCVVIKSAEEGGVVNICIFGNEELCAVVEIVQKSI